MLNNVRRLLAAGLIIAAVVGVMPLVPIVFGFASALITNDSAATYYPLTVTSSTGSPTPLIFCEQDIGGSTPGGILNLPKNGNGALPAKNWFRCTNNWGSDVTISFSIPSGGNSTSVTSVSIPTTTIPANTNKCISAVFSVANGTKTDGTIKYQAAVTSSNGDLSATLQFAGRISFPGTDTTTGCVP